MFSFSLCGLARLGSLCSFGLGPWWCSWNAQLPKENAGIILKTITAIRAPHCQTASPQPSLSSHGRFMVKMERQPCSKSSQASTRVVSRESGEGGGGLRSCWRVERDGHMFKSYASKVWLSMKFHFIGRCPGEWGEGILMHLLSGGSQAVRQTFSQPGSPVVQLELPGIRRSQEWHVCFLLIKKETTHSSGHLPTSAAPVLADVMVDTFFLLLYGNFRSLLVLSFLFRIDFHLSNP